MLTPNLPEARVLAGWGRSGEAGDAGEARDAAAGAVDEGAEDAEDTEARELARAVLAKGPKVVVLTGGHRKRAVDLYIDSKEGEAVEIPGERHKDGAAHGSGCTHSAVLAAQLAIGKTPLGAARTARRLAGEAVAKGLRDVGAGVGPVDVLGLSDLRSGIIGGR